MCCVYKLNTILLYEMKNREGKEMVTVFKSGYDELNAKGHHPTLNVQENACSSAVKEYIASKRTDTQFVKFYNHRVKAA